MSEAPERISVYPLEGTWGYGGMEFAEGDEPGLVEYVRADRIEELEAKLAKAVDALKGAAREHRVIAGMDMIGASATAYNAAREAEATIAELEGGAG